MFRTPDSLDGVEGSLKKEAGSRVVTEALEHETEIAETPSKMGMFRSHRPFQDGHYTFGVRPGRL